MTLRDEVISKLKELPAKKEEAELNFYEAIKALKEAKQDLSDKESKLFSDGKVKGKNDLERRSQLIKYTELLQREILKKEVKADIAKAKLHRLNAELESYIMIAKLIANQSEPVGIKFKLN